MAPPQKSEETRPRGQCSDCPASLVSQRVEQHRARMCVHTVDSDVSPKRVTGKMKFLRRNFARFPRSGECRPLIPATRGSNGFKKYMRAISRICEAAVTLTGWDSPYLGYLGVAFYGSDPHMRVFNKRSPHYELNGKRQMYLPFLFSFRVSFRQISIGLYASVFLFLLLLLPNRLLSSSLYWLFSYFLNNFAEYIFHEYQVLVTPRKKKEKIEIFK